MGNPGEAESENDAWCVATKMLTGVFMDTDVSERSTKKSSPKGLERKKMNGWKPWTKFGRGQYAPNLGKMDQEKQKFCYFRKIILFCRS